MRTAPTPRRTRTRAAVDSCLSFGGSLLVDRTEPQREPELAVRLLHRKLRRCARHFGVEAARVRVGELDRARETLAVEDLGLFGVLLRHRDRFVGDPERLARGAKGREGDLDLVLDR